MIEYVAGPSPELEEEAAKGKGLKAVLGIVASVFIPFAAPAIAGAIGLSGTLATSLVGAGLGAATSAVTGGNPLLGAAMGGLGTFARVGDFGRAGAAATGAGNNPVILSAGQASEGSFLMANPTEPLNIAGNAAMDAAALAAPAAQMGVGATVMSTIQRLPGQLAQRFMSRDGLAMITQMAIGAMQPQAGLEEAIAARKAELETARQHDAALYNFQVETSRHILDEAERANPEYMANMSANQAKIQGGRQSTELQRAAAAKSGFNTKASQTIKRQAGLDTARAAAGAYNEGWLKGDQTRSAKRTEARSWLPNSYPTGSNETVTNAQAQQQANDQAVSGASQWVGLLTGQKPAQPNEPDVWNSGVWGHP